MPDQTSFTILYQKLIAHNFEPEPWQSEAELAELLRRLSTALARDTGLMWGGSRDGGGCKANKSGGSSGNKGDRDTDGSVADSEDNGNRAGDKGE